MNEELKARLIGYLDTLEASLKTGSDFVGDQAPLVAQEFVAYHRVTSTAGVATGVILIVFVVAGLTLSLRSACKHGFEKPYPGGMTSGGISSVVFGALAFLCLIAMPPIMYSGFTTCMKAWFAPRVLILEEVARLVGEMT